MFINIMLVKFHCTVSSLSCVVLWSCFSLFSIIKRLDQYDEFFPAFQSLVSELKRLLSECLHIYTLYSWLSCFIPRHCYCCNQMWELLEQIQPPSHWASLVWLIITLLTGKTRKLAFAMIITVSYNNCVYLSSMLSFSKCFDLPPQEFKRWTK